MKCEPSGSSMNCLVAYRSRLALLIPMLPHQGPRPHLDFQHVVIPCEWIILIFASLIEPVRLKDAMRTVTELDRVGVVTAPVTTVSVKARALLDHEQAHLLDEASAVAGAALEAAGNEWPMRVRNSHLIAKVCFYLAYMESK